MKSIRVFAGLCLILISLGSVSCVQVPDKSLTLWHDFPAADWQSQCFPIGNGRLGCMIYGGVDKEHIQFNEDTLWIGDESDTGAYQAFGDIFIQFGDAGMEEGISNPSRHSTSSNESIDKTIDGNDGTKWCMEHKGKPVVWQVVFMNQAKKPLQSYTLTSANDVPSRDPQKWKLEASNDGETWTLLDKRSLGQPFSQRHAGRRFEFDNNRLFKVYRFTFEPVDKTHFQVAEIELGAPGTSYRELGGNDLSEQSYRRQLNIDNAVHSISYNKDGVNYRREYFASNPANVMVFHFSADKKGAHSGSISLKDAHSGLTKANGNRIIFSGALTGQYQNPNKNYDHVKGGVKSRWVAV